MITIGYSTRSSKPEYIEYLKNTCMIKNVQVIEKVNNGEKNLSEVYNEILSESIFDIVVLCHDDIEFDTRNWGNKLVKLFEKNESYGVIGLAGTTHMPSSGMWWEDNTKMFGIVNHKQNGKKWESKYSSSLGEKLKKVVIVDGLFIAVNKNRIKETFDTNVKGFHMYDINFCFNNFLNGVNIGVTTLIRVTHLSVGQTNSQWEENRRLFTKKFESNLPTKIKFNEDDELKILLCTETINDDILNQCLILPKNHIKHLLVNNISKEKSKILNKNGFTIFNENNIPNIKVGDGKWSLNINGEFRTSNVGQLYNISKVGYDIIFSDSHQVLNKLKTVFSKTPKVLLSENNISQHDTIKIINELPNDMFDLFLNIINDDENNKNKIKIVSGYSEKGGSTIALINLTNVLNSNGYDCTFYGPNSWHLDKCKSDLTENLKLDSEDILISHFIKIPSRPNVKKSIYVCHEKWWWSFKDVPKFWDTCVFLHEEHRKFHSEYNGNYNIIPNFKENLTPKEKPDLDLVAGIIGGIEDRKQTHISIQRALNDKCDKVLLYGQINDEIYFNKFVKPLIDNEKVKIIGFSSDKQEMYNSIGRVYHSSKGEVACLVKDECWLTNTKFFGNEETNNEVSLLSNDEILDLWKKLLI